MYVCPNIVYTTRQPAHQPTGVYGIDSILWKGAVCAVSYYNC